MKKLTLLIALVALSAFAFQAAFAQTQTVSINVGAVALLSTTGAATLTLGPSDIAVGEDDFDDVNSTGATSLSITHNGGAVATTAKITAGIDAPLALGTSQLFVNLAVINGGTPIANADITSAASDVNVETGIQRGAGTGTTLYTLSGVKASDGQFIGSRTVTFTITAD
jgi:hypothetical protein